MPWLALRNVLILVWCAAWAGLLIVDFLPRTSHYDSTGDVEITKKLLDERMGREMTQERARIERERSARNLAQMDLIRAANRNLLPVRDRNISADELCSRRKVCASKFGHVETRIRASPQYRLMTCIVQKSMSTVMTAIMCYLYNETAFEQSGRVFAEEHARVRFCENKNEYNKVDELKSAQGLNKSGKLDNWRFTMITRDPIDRFLSGFVDKCIRMPFLANYCNGCGRNMTCFILTEYERIMRKGKAKVKYSFEDRHFYPQNWRCDLDSNFHRYRFLRYSSDPMEGLVADLVPILREQKVPESSISFILNQLSSGRTVHSTIQSEARVFFETRLRSSPFLLEYVIRMFYHDFKLFGYNFPPGF